MKSDQQLDDHADPRNATAWRTELGGRVTVLENGMSELKSTTSALMQSVTDVGRQVELLRSDIRSDKHPTNWSAIIAALALVLAAGGGYTTLVNAPLQRQVERQHEALVDMHNEDLRTAYFRGRTEARLDAIEKQHPSFDPNRP
jgi:hypothetical protein